MCLVVLMAIGMANVLNGTYLLRGPTVLRASRPLAIFRALEAVCS